MTYTDILWIAVAALGAACLALTGIVIERKEHAAQWRQRFEEMSAWADQYQCERDIAERELDALRQRHARLHDVYLWHVRNSIAANTALIYRSKQRR